jgi:hypothetical protein
MSKFNELYESLMGDIEIVSKGKNRNNFYEIKAMLNHDEVGELMYSMDFPNKGEINIEWIEVDKNHRRKNIAEDMIKKLKSLHPKYKITGRTTSSSSANMFKKLGIHNRIDETKSKIALGMKDQVLYLPYKGAKNYSKGYIHKINGSRYTIKAKPDGSGGMAWRENVPESDIYAVYKSGWKKVSDGSVAKVSGSLSVE